MRKLSSVLLAAAVLGAARGVESGDSNAEGSAAPANCLADFNAARERAGLEAFTEEEEEGKKVPTAKEEIAKICSAIQEGAAFNITGATVERDGTYAYAPETGPADGCSAAVSYWKKAYVNFGDLPPEYNGDSAVYKDSRNISLVALYNPKEAATVDCAYITCPVSTTTTTTVATSTGSTPAEEEEDTTPENEGERTHQSVPRLSTASETVTGLVCLTNPAALENGKKPFSEDVWANIKEAIENSAPASTQSALLATALLLLTSFIVL